MGDGFYRSKDPDRINQCFSAPEMWSVTLSHFLEHTRIQKTIATEELLLLLLNTTHCARYPGFEYVTFYHQITFIILPSYVSSAADSPQNYL